MEILTNSIRENAHQAIRPLSDEGIEFVSGGCFGIPGTRPTFPTYPTGPFPA
jgi:hypothetical protein